MASERDDAFRRGYAEGHQAARREQPPQLVIRRRRRIGIGRLLLVALAMLVVVSYVVALVGGIVNS